MKINCLFCGHNIDLDDAYSENYEGAIKCYGCDTTLEIKTEQNSIRSVRLSTFRTRKEQSDEHALLHDPRTRREPANGGRADVDKI